jgi:tetratricopeptide (TPR) repeat protein
MPGFGPRIHVFFPADVSETTGQCNLLRQRAFSYEDLKQCDRAEADYNAALQIEPLDPDFYAKRGFYFSRRGRHDDALADFHKGGELVPTDGGFPFGEGEVYEKLGQHEKANLAIARPNLKFILMVSADCQPTSALRKEPMRECS